MTSQKLAIMAIAASAMFIAEPAVAAGDGEYYNDGVDLETPNRSDDRYGEPVTRRESNNRETEERYDRGYKDDYADSRRDSGVEPYARDRKYGSYKDDPLPRVDLPPPALPRYRDRRLRRHARGACLPRRLIRRGLRARGWRGIRVLRKRGRVIRVKARNRRKGGRYILTLDRCSGEILAARHKPRFFRGFRRFSRYQY